MNSFNFVAARSISLNDYYKASTNTTISLVDAITWEMQNLREVSANFVKLSDLKERHSEHALCGSSLSTIGVYLVYPLETIKRVYPSDCGSRIKEDGTLSARIPNLESSLYLSMYNEETCGYLECHVSKERSVPVVYLVVRNEDMGINGHIYLQEKVDLIKSNFPELEVVIL